MSIRCNMNAKTAEINWLGDKTGSLGNKLMGITGEERLSITFKMVKTNMQEINLSITFKLVKTNMPKINLNGHWGSWKSIDKLIVWHKGICGLLTWFKDICRVLTWFESIGRVLTWFKRHRKVFFASYSLDTKVTKEVCKLFACHQSNKRYLQAIRLTHK